ncbi:phosphoribosylformylglycinamidine synthase [Mesoterricola sediminis]|uniref:Phosphoribosylformylglycinamidine synthase n=1 Tax=Mesoterricola sediminis TaxID=2927980 RepID=A0AA48KEK3_9BACT|nr:phosphoribosylformylglycinamidine synthase [Mesoterricola sediminis]BDU75548.1 phosphoribosylformylglycinamidine synthase [Mesoterricola sediminis]
MAAIRRLFVEKKPGFDVEAGHLLRVLREHLGLTGLEALRVAVRYDVEGLSDADLDAARWTVFAEPPVDAVHEGGLPLGPGETALAVEYLPGQYDQRADSAAQCLQLLTHGARPAVATARVYVLRGALAPGDLDRVRTYLVNPVDSREASAALPTTLRPALPPPAEVDTVLGFIHGDPDFLLALHGSMGLAMTPADLAHTQAHFRDVEGREPTETELRILDTYWSDHCRHTTFLTRITEVAVEEGPLARPIARALGDYRALRARVFGEKAGDRPECLMDMALLPARALRQAGKLDDQEVSSEINACSLHVDIERPGAPGGTEPWLLMFKNETHNHPTEIEPFGGAATCLGGAIRDPLSGRSYVYQSMRVTGSGDPRTPLDQTLPGKLPQRRITQEAANGFASYGNQIGLCTGQVTEYYDPGYVAKRMEIGAVVAAAPRALVRREEPAPGDVIILVGGRTGRDGIGGATGSSKAHTEDSIETCGAEVQKGDPPMERKLQRLFRDPAFCRLVKKCNDFGAGGVAVAIGELADGIRVDLDAVPRKYEGLNGTELAIAESQERMAVVVAAEDAAEAVRLASRENLEATPVAVVTPEPRLVLTWRGRTIADLDRRFLDTNGAAQFARVDIPAPDPAAAPFAARPVADLEARWLEALSDLNACSQRGLVEKFDSTIGAASVLAPFGGRTRRTPSEAMVATFPVEDGETRSASAMSHGFLPGVSRWSPFHGAVWAHVQAAARLAATGADHRRARFTLQEYFGRPGDDPRRWGPPCAALLGALEAEMALGAPAIGGKDSMSGTFKDLDVPPTLVAFAVGVVRADQVASAELKGPGHAVVLVDLPRSAECLPDWDALDKTYARVAALVREGRALAVRTVGMDGVAPALSVMAFGNAVGVELEDREAAHWFAPHPGAFVLEMAGDPEADLEGLAWVRLGTTLEAPEIRGRGLRLSLARALEAWEAPLEPIFPTRVKETPEPLAPFAPRANPRAAQAPALGLARPRVAITAFPGSNCEYDTARVFAKAGAEVETVVFRNLDPAAVDESLEAMARAIDGAQILMIPGGFSAGDEPDGSGKFIAAAYRNPRVRDAVHRLLQARDGLVLGICNGFQALIKLGLVPYGEIREQAPGSPTLTFNNLRYASRFARTRIVCADSPWLRGVQAGDIHTVAIAHGEGRIAGPAATLQALLDAGQVATQYVDEAGRPSLDSEWNPNGSALAIEALTSPDGRVLGKMAHPERYAPELWRNVPGEKDMGIFRAGVAYFR